MGLLDDAIKEHLELKRRRGADPTEVEREEREALGPVRQMAQEAASEDLPASAPAEAPYNDDPAPERVVFEDEPRAEHAGFEDEDLFEEDTASHGVVAPPVSAPSGESVAEPDAAPTGYDEPIAPYDDEDDPETAEYDVEAQHREEAAHTKEGHEDDPESDDMLQETPEFLQDAPEHDRLWFEQRPPRDFDFDG
jgi:hypothetical protein